MINTFTEAVQTVDIEKAVGKPHSLWVAFAKFYEDNDQVPEVGETFIIFTVYLPVSVKQYVTGEENIILFLFRLELFLRKLLRLDSEWLMIWPVCGASTQRWN